MRRQLSRLDRRAWSSTYGCFDREYWHYKTLIEFPRADFQQCVWGLSLLYKTPFVGNTFSSESVVLDWIRSSLLFWAENRNSNGSVNEWYNHEGSFCATAFTSAAVAESLLLLENDLDANSMRVIRRAVEDSVAWLDKNRKDRVSNQLGAGLLAAVCLDRLAGREDSPEIEAWVDDLLNEQDEEGWFHEYVGVDIGYNLLTLDLMVQLRKHYTSTSLDRSIEMLLGFLAAFPPPGNGVGGACNSRGTNHVFVYGLEQLAAEGDASARSMLGRYRLAICRDKAPTPVTADDTYSAYFYQNSYCLLACLGGLGEPEDTEATRRQAHFPRARLYTHRSSDTHIVVDGNRGGWLMFGKELAASGDTGYVIESRKGTYTSHLAAESGELRLEQTGELTVISVRKGFSLVDRKLPLRRHIILFKAVTSLALRWNWLSARFGELVKRAKVQRVLPGSGCLSRTWTIQESSIEVVDRIILPPHSTRLFRTVEGAGQHSPSSMFFTGLVSDDLIELPEDVSGEIEVIRRVDAQGQGLVVRDKGAVEVSP